MSRRPKLTLEAVRLIDERRAASKTRIWHAKVVAHQLRVSLNTVHDAAHRRHAYARVPRG